MLKIMSAMAAAALIAGGIVAFLGTGAAVNAGTAEAVHDRRATGVPPVCVNRGWPYFDRGCRAEAHPVRLVTTDRI
jgi:hypothetical protein